MGMCAVAARIDAARSDEQSLHVRTARSAASMTTARAIFMVSLLSLLYHRAVEIARGDTDEVGWLSGRRQPGEVFSPP